MADMPGELLNPLFQPILPPSVNINGFVKAVELTEDHLS